MYNAESATYCGVYSGVGLEEMVGDDVVGSAVGASTHTPLTVTPPPRGKVWLGKSVENKMPAPPVFADF